MEHSRILTALERADRAKIIVFGDYALDKYLFSDPSRDECSVETGLAAWQVHRQSWAAGVGGTITSNLRALGAQVSCVGVVGQDGEGWALLRCLREAGADVSGMVETPQMHTCAYLKPMRKDASGSYREANRIDLRNYAAPSPEIQRELIERLERRLDWADAVIITDQFIERDMGAITGWMRERLSRMAAERADRIFFADSRSFAGEYRNMIVKCNHHEFFQSFYPDFADEKTPDAILALGPAVCKQRCDRLFVTCGEKGIVVLEDAPCRVDAFTVTGEIDIVGAGDATNAGLVLGLALGLSAPEAARLACCVSSITIQQLNATGTASMAEVRARLLA